MDGNDLDSAGLPTSFNSGLNWAGDAAPTPGNTYRTGAFLIRSPRNTTPLTFAGDSLEISTGGTFRQKTAAVITVDNLIVAQGGVVELTRPNNVNNNTAAGTLAGTMTLNGIAVFHSGIANDVAGETFTISSTIGGVGGFTTTGSNGHIILTGDNSFSGGATLAGLANSTVQLANANAIKNSTVTVNVTNGLTFAPAIGTFNIGALAGTAGATLNDTAAAAVTLAAGSNGASTTYSGSLSGLGGLIKQGVGTLTLSGGNFYSGPTTISAGKLNVTGSLGGDGAVTVNAGATLAGSGDGLSSGLINGPVTVAGGNAPAARGAIDLVNQATSTLTVNHSAGLTLGGGAGEASQLSFDVNVGSSDLLSIGASPLTLNTGGALITINNLGVVANQAYTLASFGSGAGAGFTVGTGTTVGGLTLTNPNLTFGVTGSLKVEAAQVQLITSGASAPATAYWSGIRGPEWSANNGTFGNFTTDAAGTQFIQAYPSVTTDVIFAAAGNGAPANLGSNTLGLDFQIKSLSFASGTGAAVIAGNNTLNIAAGGITVAAGNGGATLAMSTLALGANQTWSNASSQDLVVSATVSDTGQLTINNTGNGATILSGTNTYTGGTVLTAGVLRMNNNSTVGANGGLGETSGDLTVNGGRLELNGTNQKVGHLTGAGGQIVNNGAANATLTIGNSTFDPGTYQGLLTDTSNGGAGKLNLTKAGTDQIILSQANTYTGVTTLSGGVLSVGSIGNGGVAGGIGQAGNAAENLVFDGGTLQYTGPSTTIDRNFTINAGKTGGLDVATGKLTWTGTAAASTGSFTKLGAGELELSGLQAYSGRTSISEGILTLLGTTLNSVAAEGTGSLVVGSAAGNATLRLSGATLNLGGSGPAAGISSSIGHVGGSNGSLIMTGGTINVNSGAAKQNFNTGQSGYGAFTMSGGTVTLAGNFGAGSASGGLGIQNFSGGSITVNGFAGILGNVANATGVANYSGTSSFTATSATPSVVAGAFVGMAVGEGGAGILNVSGQATLSLGGSATAAGLDLGRGNAASAVGIANLGAVGSGGGTIITNAVRHSGAAGTGVLNFHGGTLRAASFADANFMTGLTGSYIYGEGATIDTNGTAVTIAQGLLAPTGEGLTGATFTGNGTGYLNTPIVTITGGVVTAPGTQATAIANFNPATGEVTGITITNPGSYTDTAGLTVSFAGGGTLAAPPVPDVLTTGANTSGGLTKTGAGSLTLAGANTYAGATTVTGGSLLVTGSLSGSVAVTSGSLGGSGSAGAATISAGAMIAPGATSSSIGNLTTGTVKLIGAAQFQLEIDSVGSLTDLLTVNGDLILDLGGNSLLSLVDLGANAAMAPGTSLTFIDYSGSWNGGIFSGFSDDSLFSFGTNQFRISYNGVNDSDTAVVLVVVPEPGSAALLLAGAGFLAAGRRKTRRKSVN